MTELDLGFALVVECLPGTPDDWASPVASIATVVCRRCGFSVRFDRASPASRECAYGLSMKHLKAHRPPGRLPVMEDFEVQPDEEVLDHYWDEEDEEDEDEM